MKCINKSYMISDACDTRWYHIWCHVHMISYVLNMISFVISLYDIICAHFIWKISLNHTWFHLYMILLMISHVSEIIGVGYDIQMSSYVFSRLPGLVQMRPRHGPAQKRPRSGSNTPWFKGTLVRIKCSSCSSPTSPCPLWLQNHVSVVYWSIEGISDTRPALSAPPASPSPSSSASETSPSFSCTGAWWSDFGAVAYHPTSLRLRKSV